MIVIHKIITELLLNKKPSIKYIDIDESYYDELNSS